MNLFNFILFYIICMFLFLIVYIFLFLFFQFTIKFHKLVCKLFTHYFYSNYLLKIKNIYILNIFNLNFFII